MLGNFTDFGADTLNRVDFIFSESRPFLVDLLGIFKPIFIKLMIDIAIEERFARHFMALGKAQHLPAKCCQAAVERVKLVNQIFDLGIVKLNAFNKAGQVFAQLLIFILFGV